MRDIIQFFGIRAFDYHEEKNGGIAIARTLIIKLKIFILDESTSFLDNESEALVWDFINRISKSITTFIVAHYFSIIRKDDMIYVIGKGRIVESGRYDAIIKLKEKYFELFKYNLKDESYNT